MIGIRRIWLGVVLFLVLAAQTGGAISVLRDDYKVQPRIAPTQLVTNAQTAYFYISTRGYEAPSQDELLEAGWKHAREVTWLSHDAARRSSLRKADDAIRADIEYIFAHDGRRVPDRKIVDAYIVGMLSAITQLHTNYYYGNFRGSAPPSGARPPFYGFVSSAEAGRLRVFRIEKGSPAEKAGLQVGDLIKGINGVALPGDWPDLKGDVLELSVSRGGSTRGLVVVPDHELHKQVTAEVLEGDIAYLAITTFRSELLNQFGVNLKNAAKALPQGAGIILDLRQNGGGLLESAILTGATLGFSGDFATVVSHNYSSFFSTTGSSTTLYSTPELKKPTTLLNSDIIVDPIQPFHPLNPNEVVVIVDSRSFSASEIVAFVLQRYSGAVVIGENTSGSARSSDTFRVGEAWMQIPMGGILLGPAEIDIEGVGVKVDEEVKLDPKRLAKGEDNVISRAIEILKAP